LWKGLSGSRKYEFGSQAPVTDLLYRLMRIMRAGDDYHRAANFLATIP
jgi:hypothetical protein